MKGGEDMENIEFHIKAQENTSLTVVLYVIAAIKKAHPNAKISIEMVM